MYVCVYNVHTYTSLQAGRKPFSLLPEVGKKRAPLPNDSHEPSSPLPMLQVPGHARPVMGMSPVGKPVLI